MRIRRLLLLPCWTVLALALGGCHYATNRKADFMDIFQFGLGLTTENPHTGMWPPTLGIYAQATEFLNLGALTFHGQVWEWDGRGLFSGFESRTRLGLLPYQEVQIDQNYAEGKSNYFKRSDTLWTARMNSNDMRWRGRYPAKELEYEFWATTRRQGTPLLHRGWQYWENFNLEIGIPEPFITHFGIDLRLGFDPSEIFDFVLGAVRIDFKRDDLTDEEFDEYLEMQGFSAVPREHKPASDAPES